MVGDHNFTLPQSVFEFVRSQVEIVFPDIDLLREDIEQPHDLLFFELSWILCNLQFVAERKRERLLIDEKRERRLFNCTVGQRLLAAYARGFLFENLLVEIELCERLV